MSSFLKRMGWRDRVGAATLGLCFAEVALVALMLWASIDYRNTVSARSEGNQTSLALDGVLLALVDSETGQRGYLITGDDRFLEPYRDGLSRLDAEFAKATALTEDDRQQAARLRELRPILDAKVADLSNSVALRAADAESARVALVEGPGKELLDEIRGRLGVLRSVTTSEVARREARATDLARISAVAAIGLAVLTVTMVSALAYLVTRRAEATLLRQETTAKDEFVGFVAHELRGPIAIIAGNAQLLAAQASIPEGDLSDSLSEIVDRSERLESIVATLLSLAKAESGQLENEPVLLQRVLGKVVASHKRRFPAREVCVDLPDELPDVLADRDALEQVILNLFTNAERYGDAHAPISVEVRVDSPKLLLSVANSGPQLDPAEFENVFQPFFRLQRSSTIIGIGLGLTVCQRLVGAQGGSMMAEALPEGGARFGFSLPIAPTDGNVE